MGMILNNVVYIDFPRAIWLSMLGFRVCMNYLIILGEQKELPLLVTFPAFQSCYV